MAKGWDDSWRNLTPGPKTPASSTRTVPTDRGSRRGAKRCIVTEQLQILDHSFAKESGATGEFFQSRKEAQFYIQRLTWFRAGLIRPLPGKAKWRQVPFELITLTPAGLKIIVARLILDFAFERTNDGSAHYQDVKPGGGFREDTYILKKKFFEAQYGVSIEEL